MIINQKERQKLVRIYFDEMSSAEQGRVNVIGDQILAGIERRRGRATGIGQLGKWDLIYAIRRQLFLIQKREARRG